jgi:hypothetical protein
VLPQRRVLGRELVVDPDERSEQVVIPGRAEPVAAASNASGSKPERSVKRQCSSFVVGSSSDR